MFTGLKTHIAVRSCHNQSLGLPLHSYVHVHVTEHRINRRTTA